jgi:hypothetical protein
MHDRALSSLRALTFPKLGTPAQVMPAISLSVPGTADSPDDEKACRVAQRHIWFKLTEGDALHPRALALKLDHQHVSHIHIKHAPLHRGT